MGTCACSNGCGSLVIYCYVFLYFVFQTDEYAGVMRGKGGDVLHFVDRIIELVCVCLCACERVRK